MCFFPLLGEFFLSFGKRPYLEWWRDKVTEWQTDRQTGRQIDRQADRQAGRQIDRQADRKTGRQIGRQTGRHTDRQTDIHLSFLSFIQICVWSDCCFIIYLKRGMIRRTYKGIDTQSNVEYVNVYLRCIQKCIQVTIWDLHNFVIYYFIQCKNVMV